MRFGPISSLDLNRLTDILESAGVAYDVEVSQGDLDAFAADRLEQSRNPQHRPTFEGLMEYIYLTVPDASVPLIRAELSRLAVGAAPAAGSVDSRTAEVEGFGSGGAGGGDSRVLGHELDEVNDGFDELVRQQREGSHFPKYLAIGLLAFIAALVYWLKNN